MEQFLNTIIETDASILLYLNSLHSSYWDGFMDMFSGRFIWVPMYAAFVWMVWRSFSWKAAVVVTLMGALLITLSDQTCATMIRPYVERIRPSRLENALSEYVHVVNGHRGGLYGFPSCHAANSFAFALFSLLLVRRRAWSIFILTWAVVNSYSRIYLGVHFPGDLLVGAAVGCFSALSVYWLTLVLSRRLCHAVAPFAMPRMRLPWGHAVYPCTVVMAVGIAIVAYIAVTAAF